MEYLPSELLCVISDFTNDLTTLIKLSHVTKVLNRNLWDYLRRRMSKYMLMVTGKKFRDGYGSVGDNKVRYTGFLAKKVTVNNKGDLMIIGIDDYCYETDLSFYYCNTLNKRSKKNVVQIVNNRGFNLFLTQDKELCPQPLRGALLRPSVRMAIRIQTPECIFRKVYFFRIL